MNKSIRRALAGRRLDVWGAVEIEVTLEPIGLPDVKELYDYLTTGKPLTHDGRWALATLEVCTAIRQSSEEGREIALEHQTAVPALDVSRAAAALQRMGQ